MDVFRYPPQNTLSVAQVINICTVLAGAKSGRRRIDAESGRT
jgi:hypothetical protein